MKDFTRNKLYLIFSFFLAVLFFNGCRQPDTEKQKKEAARSPEHDHHSFSNTDEVKISHMDLEMEVSFEEKKIIGKAVFNLEFGKKTNEVVLDTKELLIDSVLADSNRRIAFTMGKKDPVLGEPLQIRVNYGTKKIVIFYQTTPKSEALQWLEPSQTGTKKYPFLYTQSEPHLARSWFPCADSPGSRFTYHARVKVPKGLMAVMSASNATSLSDDGIYECTMDKPIPAYLVALAVGKLEFRPIGKRSGVYAEPTMVGKAAVEFSEVEKMMEVAERLYGPYRWGRYDVVVLPPSFPFGGMENPMLTFLTPTIITGDKSLTAVLAHELAHSWSGNLVTNKTWNDFWLNEGFTVYFERRIIEELNGKDYMDMQAVIGWQDLQETMSDMGKNDPGSKLKLDLTGRNPDDGMNDVAYEKGYLFLKRVEELAGRTKTDIFLRNYFDRNAFKSMTTERFLKMLEKDLLNSRNGLKGKLNFQEWVYQPGLPADCPVIRSTRYDAVDSKAKQFSQLNESAAKLGLQYYETWEWLRFLDQLPDSISYEKMKSLDNAYNLTNCGNAEVLNKWLRLCISSDYNEAEESLEYFLMHVGRRKFIKPLYHDLLNKKDGRERALGYYEKAKNGYHSILKNTLEEMLQISNVN